MYEFITGDEVSVIGHGLMLDSEVEADLSMGRRL